MNPYSQQKQPRLRDRIRAALWHDLTLLFAPITLLCVLAVAMFVWLVDPAPPKTITISAGPRDSSFLPVAEQYRQILAHNGITLKVLTSDGSLQNLQRLLDPKEHVDLALVQG